MSAKPVIEEITRQRISEAEGDEACGLSFFLHPAPVSHVHRWRIHPVLHEVGELHRAPFDIRTSSFFPLHGLSLGLLWLSLLLLPCGDTMGYLIQASKRGVNLSNNFPHEIGSAL